MPKHETRPEVKRRLADLEPDEVFVLNGARHRVMTRGEDAATVVELKTVEIAVARFDLPLDTEIG